MNRVIAGAPPTAYRRDRERGFVGGAEVLPFGFLLFVSVLLLIVNAWAVIDTKLAVSAAAREGARVYVESDSEDAAIDAAVAHARAALRSFGRDNEDVSVAIDAEGFARCARVSVTVRTTVPALTLPFIGGFGSGVTAQSTHSEIIDPFRSGDYEGSCS